MAKLVSKDAHAHVSISGLVERDVPYVQVKNLTAFVHSRLDESNNANKLTWHEGSIPSEVWLKMGGNHGGGSFKMAIQVLNVVAPNALEHTIATLCVEGRDSDENSDRMVGAQEESATFSFWRLRIPVQHVWTFRSSEDIWMPLLLGTNH